MEKNYIDRLDIGAEVGENLRTLETQSIEQSLRENFSAYPDAYKNHLEAGDTMANRLYNEIIANPETFSLPFPELVRLMDRVYLDYFGGVSPLERIIEWWADMLTIYIIEKINLVPNQEYTIYLSSNGFSHTTGSMRHCTKDYYEVFGYSTHDEHPLDYEEAYLGVDFLLYADITGEYRQ